MALSPEDVIKKSFSPTHLRRGYDETQVDDFLDEVVVELRRLLAENEGLRTDLADCRASNGLADSDSDGTGTTALVPSGFDDETARTRHAQLTAELEDLEAKVEARRAELETGGLAVDGEPRDADADVSSGELEELRGQLSVCQEARARAEAEAEELRRRIEASELSQAEVFGAAGAAPAAEDTSPGAGTVHDEDPSSIISLAQRLHDQHVAEGESTKKRLVTEAETYRDQVVGEADERSTELVRTGQETHDRLVEEGQEMHDEFVRVGQETHDQLVEAGQTKHDELVRTGQETHDRLVEEGRTTKEQLVGEAEQQRSGILNNLGKQQTALNGRIQELRTQEVDLRDRLRAFLSDQLSKIDGDRQA